MKKYIFVYGTLRRGFEHPLASLLEKQAEFIGIGHYQGRLYDLGSYPGVIASDNPLDKVQGDVYQLDTTTDLLSKLDAYEGFVPQRPDASLYLREVVRISLTDGAVIDSSIYLYNQPVPTEGLIPCGDYLAYLGEWVVNAY